MQRDTILGVSNMRENNKIRSHCAERASKLDFKDAAAAPRFGQVAYCILFVMNIKGTNCQSSAELLHERNLWSF